LNFGDPENEKAPAAKEKRSVLCGTDGSMWWQGDLQIEGPTGILVGGEDRLPFGQPDSGAAYPVVVVSWCFLAPLAPGKFEPRALTSRKGIAFYPTIP
jgi:hypothetical protein